jgi:hypothetical protein
LSGYCSKNEQRAEPPSAMVFCTVFNHCLQQDFHTACGIVPQVITGYIKMHCHSMSVAAAHHEFNDSKKLFKQMTGFFDYTIESSRLNLSFNKNCSVAD